MPLEYKPLTSSQAHAAYRKAGLNPHGSYPGKPYNWWAATCILCGGVYTTTPQYVSRDGGCCTPTAPAP